MNTETASLKSFPATSARPSPANRAVVGRAVAVAMAVWLGAVFFLGARGAFIRPPGAPPLPILFGATLPLLAFFAAYFGSGAFRSFVLTSDVRLIAAIQAWRVGGLAFLDLYAHGLLPGLFAWPAGLGDIAVGATAPLIALALMRQPDFAASRRFVTWNILGIVDLVVAVTMGALSSGILKGLTGGVTTAPMTELPLLLIPVYFVPFFVMLHFTALVQARRRR
jgi:hypothetical protein